MDTKTRNEIALWLLDRVAQGAREEVGSMDWLEINDGQEEHRISIMRDVGGVFLVWMSERSFCADFTLSARSTENSIRKKIDDWYDSF